MDELGFYDSILYLDIIIERKKDNILVNCISSQADPEKLRKQLYLYTQRSEKLDVVGLDTLKEKLAKGSKISVK